MDNVKNNGVITLPLRVNEEQIFADSLQIIKSVRPHWDDRNLDHKVFTAGIMNKLVGIFHGGNKNDMVLVKVFGANTEIIVDRESEVSAMKLLHEKGCGPALYAVFNNGICYEFIPGSTLTFNSVRDPTIFPLVAAEMARMHSTIPFEGSDDPTPISHIWKKLKEFRDLDEEILLNNSTIKKRLEKLGMPTGWCRSSIEELELIFAKLKIPITFSHNDLLLENIIYNKESQKVSFIDFEYAMPNYAPFDVANHFLEFAGIDPPDFSKCPSREFMSEWIKVYLRHLEVKQSIAQETFEYWVQLCFPVSHLLWTLWALFQAHNSTIGYDYIGYVELRFLEYEKLMKPVREQNI